MTDAAVSPDTERFTFTENGPWVLDRDSLAWARGLPVLRMTV